MPDIVFKFSREFLLPIIKYLLAEHSYIWTALNHCYGVGLKLRTTLLIWDILNTVSVMSTWKLFTIPVNNKATVYCSLGYWANYWGNTTDSLLQQHRRRKGNTDGPIWRMASWSRIWKLVIPIPISMSGEEPACKWTGISNPWAVRPSSVLGRTSSQFQPLTKTDKSMLTVFRRMTKDYE